MSLRAFGRTMTRAIYARRLDRIFGLDDGFLFDTTPFLFSQLDVVTAIHGFLQKLFGVSDLAILVLHQPLQIGVNGNTLSFRSRPESGFEFGMDAGAHGSSLTFDS